MSHPFEYKEPTSAQVEQMGEIRDECHALYKILNQIPPSRERSLAMTKLEEVSMWANKAVVFSEAP